MNGRSNLPVSANGARGGDTHGVQDPIEFDLDRIDALIEREEAELEPKQQASIAYREVADRYIAGGVASSWQDSPPHAIFVDHGKGNQLWDIDQNEYIDFHLGYGAMVVGHAHPKIVDGDPEAGAAGTHFAQPTKGLDVVGENLTDRFSCRSGASATRAPRPPWRARA